MKCVKCGTHDSVYYRIKKTCELICSTCVGLRLKHGLLDWKDIDHILPLRGAVDE